MVLGEGAAMLVLEPLEAARARGARIHAENRGLRHVLGRSHITQPSAGGTPLGRCGQRCATHSLAPEPIGYINAHGTGTQANDPTETAAIRAVFGAHADRLAVSSTKSMHGHALGAAGALECLAAAMLALRDGVHSPHRQLHPARSGVRPRRRPQRHAPRSGIGPVEFLRVRRAERGAGVSPGVIPRICKLTDGLS